MRTLLRAEVAALVPLLLGLGWAALLLIDSGGDGLRAAIQARGWNWLTTLFFAAAFVCSLLALWRESEGEEEGSNGPGVPVFALMTVAYLLVLGAELFYVKDVFGNRLNTVFKLYYQAWILLAVAAACASWWLVRGWRPRPASFGGIFQSTWATAAAVVVGAALLYPLGATLSRTDALASRPRTLNGLAAARTQVGDDLAIATWLSARAGPDERVLEATKGSYSDAGRISGWSGVPTVLGWFSHEQQWGRKPAGLAMRLDDVNNAYRSPSLAEALAILQKYDVAYVVVGTIERALYPPEGLKKFDGGLPVAFSFGQATLYRISGSENHPDVKAP